MILVFIAMSCTHCFIPVVRTSFSDCFKVSSLCGFKTDFSVEVFGNFFGILFYEEIVISESNRVGLHRRKAHFNPSWGFFDPFYKKW